MSNNNEQNAVQQARAATICRPKFPWIRGYTDGPVVVATELPGVRYVGTDGGEGLTDEEVIVDYFAWRVNTTMVPAGGKISAVMARSNNVKRFICEARDFAVTDVPTAHPERERLMCQARGFAVTEVPTPHPKLVWLKCTDAPVMVEGLAADVPADWTDEEILKDYFAWGMELWPDEIWQKKHDWKRRAELKRHGRTTKWVGTIDAKNKQVVGLTDNRNEVVGAEVNEDQPRWAWD